MQFSRTFCPNKRLAPIALGLPTSLGNSGSTTVHYCFSFCLAQPLKLDLPSRIYYRPQRSCGQGNVFTGVCLSTGGEGVCLSACWDAIPPRMETPLGWRTPPGMENPPWDGEPPLGWRTPPDGEPPPMENPPGMETPPDGEPPGMENPPSGSRLQHTVYERPVRILLECILVVSYFVKDR